MATTSTPGNKPFSENASTTDTLKDATQAAKDTAKDLAAQGSSAISKGAEALKEKSRAVATDVRSEASSLAAGATEKAKSLAEEQKNAGAERLSSVASAVDRAAGDLEEASPHTARLIRQAASRVENLSSQLRDRSVDDIVGTARDYARRQPLAVFGGAVVAGILLSRFLKSSAETKSDQYATPVGTPRDDWSSKGNDTWPPAGRSLTSTDSPLSPAQPQSSNFGTVSGGTNNGI